MEEEPRKQAVQRSLVKMSGRKQLREDITTTRRRCSAIFMGQSQGTDEGFIR
jgi:hypothetical protein